jgi:fermentation-respiration switch protein FrsA (DUF1100 family)
MFAVIQRRLIFIPFRESAIRVENAGLPQGAVHDIVVRAKDGLDLHGWHLLADGRVCRDAAECDAQLAQSRFVVLYFSGNAANRRYRVDECRVLTGLGADVLIVDYRGYGDNQGSPSEKRLAGDALDLWRYVTVDRNVDPRRIMLYGESLGGAVATGLAAEVCRSGTPPAGLTLRSTFSSLPDVGAHHYPWLPVKLCVIDCFDSSGCIAAVTCPILQVHGERDDIVPMEFGRRLFDLAADRSENGVAKSFVTLPGANHNDVLWTAEDPLREAVRSFFSAVDASPSAPPEG